MNRGYSRETKTRAVRLHLEGKKVPEIAAELGVSEATIRRWLKDPSLECGPQALEPPFPSRSTRELIEASVSENTRRSYLHALTRFDEWLETHPSGSANTDAAIADYLTQRYEEGKSPATCEQVVAALKFRAKLHGTGSPTGPVTDRVLAGIRRKGRHRGRGQVQGVSLEMAEHVAAVAARDGLAGLRDAALIMVGSEGMLRVSELAGLLAGDLDYLADGSGRVTIRASKTDQEGSGRVLFLGPTAVGRIRAWVRAAGIEEGPLFRRLHRNERVGDAALSTASIREIIKSRCERAGITGYISGHSLRVGAAQSLAEKGASLVELQNAGRWTSPSMPAHYTQSQQAARGAIARLRHHHRPEDPSR